MKERFRAINHEYLKYLLKNEIMPYIIEMMEEENSNEKT